jgi:uncharacterized protein (TIGR02996 family)
VGVLESLLQAVVADPRAEDLWLVLADWLEENGDPRRAELLRLHRRLLATCCDPDKHPGRAAWQATVVRLLGAGVRPCVPHRTVPLAAGVALTFAFIPPGSFLAEEQARGELPAFRLTDGPVTLATGFWLGTHPVTQAQWQAVTGRNPSKFRGDALPVEHVSWDDCQEFVARLSERTGQRFRLPGEVEWEYACRAGTTTPFFFGETIFTNQANYDGTTRVGGGPRGVDRKQTTPVGSFPPNAWGLYDQHGNVLEWCQDRSRPAEEFAPEELGVAHGVRHPRVLRGGSWGGSPLGCRSAYRNWNSPTYRGDCIGCRVLLCPDGAAL